jgi:hypothetical protein
MGAQVLFIPWEEVSAAMLEGNGGVEVVQRVRVSWLDLYVYFGKASKTHKKCVTFNIMLVEI